MSARIKAIEQELIDGRGFVRVRGVDRSAYDQAEMEMLYWGFGTHLGLPWAQNHHGHVLGDVTDQQKAYDDPTARGNELGGVALPFHCDGSDLVGLLCLTNGIAGTFWVYTALTLVSLLVTIVLLSKSTVARTTADAKAATAAHISQCRDTSCVTRRPAAVASPPTSSALKSSVLP